MVVQKWDGKTYKEPSTLVKLIENAVQKFGPNKYIGTRMDTGEYNWITYSEFGKRLQNIRAGLAQLGIKGTDMVSYIGFNSVEWALTAYACYELNAVFVPMYEREIIPIIKYILNDAEIKLLVVANQSLLEKVVAMLPELPKLKQIVLIKGTVPVNPKIPVCLYEEMEQKGKSNPVPITEVTPQDLAVIIYTSGTTGDPKGVMLTQGNLSQNAIMNYEDFSRVNEKTRSLSHLPWAHAFGQVGEVYLVTNYGGSIGIVGSIDTLAHDMQKLHPNLFISVPRLYNKLYGKIKDGIHEKGPTTEKLFNKAIALGKDAFNTGKPSFLFKILDKIVLKKVRHQLGVLDWQDGICGSAKLNPEIIWFFNALGMRVLEGYGATEASPVISANSSINMMAGYRVGSIGKPMNQITVEIDKSQDPTSNEGEIVAYGPCIMKGYWKKPEKTKEVINAQGGLRTGDRGYIDQDGFIYITGRFKEEYKLANGKYCHPADVEEAIKQLPYISNCMVYGDGKDYNVLVATLDKTIFEKFVHEMKINASVEDVVHNRPALELMMQAIQSNLKGKFEGYEIPRKLIIVKEEWSIDNGMLTQTLKLKRRMVLDKYKQEIANAYELK